MPAPPARNCSLFSMLVRLHSLLRTVTSSLAGIIMPPHFRQPTALLNCEEETLRWPGPFDTGFLSPQPPGVAGIGSIAEQIIPILGQRELVLFLFQATVQPASTRGRPNASPKSPRLSRPSKSPPALQPTWINVGLRTRPSRSQVTAPSSRDSENRQSRFQKWVVSSDVRPVWRLTAALHTRG